MNNDDLIITNEYSENSNFKEIDLEEYICNKNRVAKGRRGNLPLEFS